MFIIETYKNYEVWYQTTIPPRLKFYIMINNERVFFKSKKEVRLYIDKLEHDAQFNNKLEKLLK